LATTDAEILKASAESPLELRIIGASEALELLAGAAASGDKPALKRFKITAYTGGPMNVGYGAPVVVDLAGMEVPHQNIPILRDHDHSQIVAHADSVEKTPQRLKLAGVMSGVGPAAQEVVALAANGFPWQASIGASVQKMERIADGESVTVNGKSVDGPAYVARNTVLGETSFVAMGADCHTSGTVTGRFRPGGMVILAFVHNSIVAPGEPQWPGVDKAKLPDMAFADRPDRSYPHHWVKGGGEPDDKGRDTTGTLYLHKEGLNAAWAAANGARSGQKAPAAVINHLQAHRRALGIKD
jgi:hypothetical protein